MLQVPRLLFKRLVSVEYAQIMSLHEGEAYAMCNLTKTDRLGLLIEGKVCRQINTDLFDWKPSLIEHKDNS